MNCNVKYSQVLMTMFWCGNVEVAVEVTTKTIKAPLDSRWSGPGLSPGLCHCVVFLNKTLYSQSASLQAARSINGY